MVKKILILALWLFLVGCVYVSWSTAGKVVAIYLLDHVFHLISLIWSSIYFTARLYGKRYSFYPVGMLATSDRDLFISDLLALGFYVFWLVFLFK
jgi:hypothetical protein